MAKITEVVYKRTLDENGRLFSESSEMHVCIEDGKYDITEAQASEYDHMYLKIRRISASGMLKGRMDDKEQAMKKAQSTAKEQTPSPNTSPPEEFKTAQERLKEAEQKIEKGIVDEKKPATKTDISDGQVNLIKRLTKTTGAKNHFDNEMRKLGKVKGADGKFDSHTLTKREAMKMIDSLNDFLNSEK